MKKLYLFLILIINALYAFAIFTINNKIGDIVSPILMLIAFCHVFYGFVVKEKNHLFKLSGLFLAISIFSWFICDFIWGLSTLVLHINPEDSLIIMYGYSLVNLFLFISLVISGYIEICNLNKIKVLLDTLIVSINIMVLLWVFVFDKDIEKAKIIMSDPVVMLSLIMDSMIFAWTIIWFFSSKMRKIPLFYKLSAVGGVIFVISDFSYYYVYYYTEYEPNSWIDGAYMIAFILFGLSGYVKTKERIIPKHMLLEQRVSRRFNKEAIILLLPLFILIFKRDQIQYFLFLIFAILIYYVFLNYTQKNDYREELFRIEKKHNAELEEKVEERTKEIVKIMNTDMITGLFNRRYFEEYLLRTCNSIGKHESVSLLYIDLNKYRSIKAMYGKYVAESLLKEIGNKIQKIIYEQEQQSVLAAYGEDIFVITLSNISKELCLNVAQSIINGCSGRYHINDHVIAATLNIGIASYPVDAKNHEELIKNADIAMMSARKQGYNRISTYNENMGSNMYDRNKIEVKLKKVNFDEEFQLYFQPQVACETGKIIGVEALIRWYTKQGEFIPPNKFIPLAEESGLIVPLGYWIMEQAAKQLSVWREQSFQTIRMAINVSVRQLSEPDFSDRLFEVLEKYQISPELFEIEITENIQVEGNSEVDINLKAIMEKGISIAIDDFGTGYSSLYYIKNLPMQRIKIAKELVDDIENDSYNLAIIKIVIQIAKTREIKVIAEGVETKEQWECLKALNCDEIQGYYFAKPMPGVELFSKWLDEENSK